MTELKILCNSKETAVLVRNGIISEMNMLSRVLEDELCWNLRTVSSIDSSLGVSAHHVMFTTNNSEQNMRELVNDLFKEEIRNRSVYLPEDR